MTPASDAAFLSYRRTDINAALAVYQGLKARGLESVFFDYSSLGSGSFEAQIVENIRARPNFVLVLTPTALDRCGDPDDWLRREIEEAICAGRNIVPLLMPGFSFGAPNVRAALTGGLALLSGYNGIEVHMSMFDAVIDTLVSDRYLRKPLTAVIHPASVHAEMLAREAKASADAKLKDRLKRTQAKNKRMAQQIAAAKAVLADVTCPMCGAAEVEKGVGRDPSRYDGYEWEYASYECGYAVTDDKQTGVCRNSAEGRAHAKIQEVKFPAALVANTASIKPFGDARNAKMLAAWDKALEENGNNIEALTHRAEAHLAGGNAHDAIKDITRAGELGGLRFANTGPQLKAMILHIRSEWMKLQSRTRRADAAAVASAPVRLPLLDLYQAAMAMGIDFRVGHSILKFTRAVRQGAIDGRLALWGRAHRHVFEELNRNEPLVPIDAAHWIDFLPDWPTAAVLGMTDGQSQGLRADNYPFRSYVPGSPGRGGYNDLHVNGRQARVWLETVRASDFNRD